MKRGKVIARQRDQPDRSLPKRNATHYNQEVQRREILWTEEAEDHIAPRNITLDDVEDVIYTSPRLTLPGRGGTTLMLGTTAAGRYLLVVLSEALDGRWYIVTARDQTPDERRLLRKKGR